ncbi:hypothetical protein [uncultured Shewanella sp.]|uniref:hypothetical protein n=1 Tax=uncultured Shewanella sp. TaxID=173975 RepID=UPI00260D5F5F|nr:hypothetical protein [uncultured Shewanella sp.]
MKKVVVGLFGGFALLVMTVATFYNDNKEPESSLVNKNDTEQQISLSQTNDLPEWDKRSTEILTDSVRSDNRRNIKETLKEKSQSQIISALSGLSSEIGSLFLELDGVKAVDTLDHQGLKTLNEQLSQFYIDHDIINMINKGSLDGDDRQAVSLLFAYTTKLRESISEQNIAVLRSKVDQLQEEINSGELPLPQPLSFAQRQAIEQQAAENYQKRQLERDAKRKKEDEQLAKEEIAFLSGK